MLYPTSASSPCAPPGSRKMRMWVQTISRIATARITTPVSRCIHQRRRGAACVCSRSSSRIGQRCQSRGSSPSRRSSRIDISTYENESPPRSANVADGSTRWQSEHGCEGIGDRRVVGGHVDSAGDGACGGHQRAVVDLRRGRPRKVRQSDRDDPGLRESRPRPAPRRATRRRARGGSPATRWRRRGPRRRPHTSRDAATSTSGARDRRGRFACRAPSRTGSPDRRVSSRPDPSSRPRSPVRSSATSRPDARSSGPVA